MQISYNGNTVNISHAATAAELENALESTLITGAIDVTRSGPDRNNGYSWTVAFVQLEGDVSELVFQDTYLTGTGATGSVVEDRKGHSKRFKQ